MTDAERSAAAPSAAVLNLDQQVKAYLAGRVSLDREAFQSEANPSPVRNRSMEAMRGGEARTLRAEVAMLERRVGGLAVVLGALALLGFVVLQGDEHRLVVLALAGLPLLLGGGSLVVAGRILGRPGRLAVLGQALPILVAVHWILLVGS